MLSNTTGKVFNRATPCYLKMMKINFHLEKFIVNVKITNEILKYVYACFKKKYFSYTNITFFSKIIKHSRKVKKPTIGPPPPQAGATLSNTIVMPYM